MKITLDIPDGIIAGFFNGVEVTAHGMQVIKVIKVSVFAKTFFKLACFEKLFFVF